MRCEIALFDHYRPVDHNAVVFDIGVESIARRLRKFEDRGFTILKNFPNEKLLNPEQIKIWKEAMGSE